MIHRNAAPRKRRLGKRRGRIEDPAYLDFIREQPCLLCARIERHGGLLRGTRQHSPTEAAHVGKHGMSQKCDDRDALPLCGEEHHREGPLSQHKLGKQFWGYHKIGRAAEIAHYNALYESTRQAKP